MRDAPSPPDGAATYSKHVKLTAAGRTQIEEWATANGLNFSAAIETLALLGLNDERSRAIVPVLRDVTRQGLALSFNRLARLLFDMAVDAAATRTLAEAILLQQMRSVAVTRPTDFETVMRVPRDSPEPLDGRLRRFHDSVKASIEEDVMDRLRRKSQRWRKLKSFFFDEEDEQ